MKPWSSEAQHDRRRELAAYIRSRLRPLLGADARAEHLVWWDQDRVAIWASHAFFLGGAADAAFANVMLRYALGLPFTPGPNVFGAAALAGVLACHDAKLATDVRAAVRERLAEILPFGMTADFQFNGYNDNMPIMWTWALAFGGELLGDERFTTIAWANLCQLRDLLRRRGTVSEYGAGYATHRLTGLAHLATHVRDDRLRELARQCEARLWAELAGHWSPAVAQIGGASMRGGSPLNQETPALLRQVFGDAVTKIPWQHHVEVESRAVVRSLGLDESRYLFAYPFGYAAEFASAEYHIPDAIAELFYQKPVGFTFQCTAENGYVNGGIFCKQIPVYGQGGVLITTKLTNEVVMIKDHPEHGAQPHALTTFHGANYVVGSSSSAQFFTSHAFRCTYRRARGLGEVFVRFNINDKIPGGRTRNRYWKSPDFAEERENYCELYYDCGSYHCLQHRNTVLCLQRPEYFEHWDIRSLRTDIFFWQAAGPVVPVIHHDRLITIEDGPVYIAIHPLIGWAGLRAQPVIVREIGGWCVISLYNYEGPSRQVTPHEIARIGNGFVFEVRDAAEYPSFGAFLAEMEKVRILDQHYAGRRRVHYARPDLRLSTQYCPYTRTVMTDSINGREFVCPQFAYSDGRHRGLPFLDGAESVGFADWDWLVAQHNRPRETYNPDH